ncbi:Telomere repeat-binding protein [Quillaja saponaria]|uniref:Telomere repeat-binding protein n=1 Tax=Quillaja saponaria TaxID=32244 RepID=A0AAD7KX86_QUISA|nr:Telomere repeat-binding protein [Quillaja saponaria]
MVLQKRLEFGFNGYQVPTTPRATRSARRRGTIQKRVEDNQLCAFDLLATVAGKLLLEKESSVAYSNASTEKDKCGFVKKEWEDANNPLKAQLSEEGSSGGRYVFDLASHAYDQNCNPKESPNPENDGHSGSASVLTTSSCSEKFVAEKMVNAKSNKEVGSFASKVGCSGYAEFSGCKLDDEINKLKDEQKMFGKVPFVRGTDRCSAEDPVNAKPPAVVSSDDSAKFSLYVDHIPHSASPCQDDLKVVSRDDDENSSGCTHPRTKTKSFRPVTRIGDRRIRKILASKYWKVAPKLKADRRSNTDGDLKPMYRNKRNSYKRLRSQMNIPFKKRKLFYGNSVSSSDGCIRSDGISCSSEKGINGDAPGSSAKIHGAAGKSSSVAGQQTAFHSRDSHVKLRIKSFRVPELFIEIPETATVGSLKRTVMEAVTAILGGGLRVGVVLQGKKVRDDSKTLLQTGISQDNQLDALGFTLEPSSLKSVPPICAVDSTDVLPCDVLQPLTRYLPDPTEVQQGISDALLDPQVTNLGNFIESDNDSAPSSTNSSVDKSTRDSKPLVPIPETAMEALAVVSEHRKSKRSEIAQRRIRRPFSVTEVEALVQAVEKLGTGRWRDVKLRSFDNAKHRTYVDLKDKWKTLVHTARISPQQRRGEPVPQELLDRVLTAHSYWSQQQTKQQVKQQPDTCLLL